MTGSSPAGLTARGADRPARRLTLVALFAALTAVGAQIHAPLPFTPVPIVLSNFFALLAGLVLGPRLGAASQVVYVLLGAVGVPVFAGPSGGLQVLLGPTGGYLFGFVFAAAAAGALRGSRPDARRAMVAAAVGAVLIYVAGVLWLAFPIGMGLTRAVAVGVLQPFLVGDAVKVVIAGLAAPALLRSLGAQGARSRA